MIAEGINDNYSNTALKITKMKGNNVDHIMKIIKSGKPVISYNKTEIMHAGGRLNTDFVINFTGFKL